MIAILSIIILLLLVTCGPWLLVFILYGLIELGETWLRLKRYFRHD